MEDLEKSVPERPERDGNVLKRGRKCEKNCRCYFCTVNGVKAIRAGKIDGFRTFMKPGVREGEQSSIRLTVPDRQTPRGSKSIRIQIHNNPCSGV